MPIAKPSASRTLTCPPLTGADSRISDRKRKIGDSDYPPTNASGPAFVLAGPLELHVVLVFS
jgi:hypothetical protein